MSDFGDDQAGPAWAPASPPPKSSTSGYRRSSPCPSSPPTPSLPPPTPPRRYCWRSSPPARPPWCGPCPSPWPSPALLAIVALSYQQTVHAYPNGGGSYVVSRVNLGLAPGLVAAASLMVGYVATVAVSVASGVAAITSAFPALYDYRLRSASPWWSWWRWPTCAGSGSRAASSRRPPTSSCCSAVAW